MLPGVRALLPWLAAAAGASAPQPLVTSSGELISANAAAVAASLPASSGLSVVASVGGDHRGSRLLNAVFGTSFATELQLDASEESTAGAWLAASPGQGALVLETKGGAEAAGEARPAADACKLATFSLTLADAIIVHSPCVAPSASLLQSEYERLFSYHLAAAKGAIDDSERTVIVHVLDAIDGPAEATVRAAAKEAWTRAAASTEMRGKSFADCFDLEVVPVPASASSDAAAYEAGVTMIKAVLSRVGAPGKVAKSSAFADAAASAWQAAHALLEGQPSEAWLRDRYIAARAYESAYRTAQNTLRKWAPTVAKGRLVHGFGPAATALVSSALSAFDAAVVSTSPASAPLLAQRRARLSKALVNDVNELFLKQHRTLSVSTINRLKSQLLKVNGRGGTVAEWQQDGLRKNAEKHFDYVLGGLMVTGVGDVTRAQLVTAFGKQLTETCQKFLESPPMQLQAIAAMRRRTGKGPKPPRGIRTGLGLVGAIRSKYAGGQGNLQTYAGYVDGLNSGHIMFANDGNIADSSGGEPPLWRWQPKLNFDISI